LRKHYQSADVFVFPSFFEGFALVLLESMACGLPVVASDASGATDIIDEQTGKLLPPGDVEAWTDGLRAMAERRDQLPQMKAAARAKALQHTWDRYRKAVCNSVAAYS